MPSNSETRVYLADWENCRQKYTLPLILWVRMHLGPKLSTHPDADELLRDAFLEGLEKRDQFKGQTEVEFLRWMRDILVSRLEKQATQTGPGFGGDVTPDMPKPPDPSTSRIDKKFLIYQETSPSMRAYKMELEIRMALAMSQLPELQREVLLQYHFEGRTFAQIAENMDGRTPEALKKAWVQTLPVLRKMIGDES